MYGSEVTIVGLGALGTALARALSQKGWRIKSVFNRTPDRANELAEELDISTFGSFPPDAADLGDLIFLTVTDSSIQTVAANLSSLSDDFGSKTFVHCSGNESSELLDSLSAKGAFTAAFHPMQSFTGTSSPAGFGEIYFSIEGDNEAIKKMDKVAESLGAHSFVIKKESKPYLHAAAVMASNYLVSLIAASTDIGSLGNINEAELHRALMPLMQRTLQNVEKKPVSEALSGPILRGDLETVEKHLRILKSDRELYSLYKSLGRRTLEIAVKRDTLERSIISSLKSILKE